MATSVIALSATINAGTPVASPATVNLTQAPSIVNKIRWRVPPGPRGNLGWQLTMGGQPVVPAAAGEFVVADDEEDDWEIAGLPDSGAWQLTGYNTGTYNHTVYLYFFNTPIQLSVAGGGNILDGFPTSDAMIPGMWLT